jgi:hypothetical protein
VSGIIRHCSPDICFVPLSHFFIYLLVIMPSIMPQLFPHSRLFSEIEWVSLSAEPKVLLPHSWLFATDYYTVRNSTSSLPHLSSSWRQCNYYNLPSTLLSSKRSLSVRCLTEGGYKILIPLSLHVYPLHSVLFNVVIMIITIIITISNYIKIINSSACNFLHFLILHISYTPIHYNVLRHMK